MTEDQAWACIRHDPTSFVYRFVKHASRFSDAPLFYNVVAAYSALAAVVPSDLALNGLGGGEVTANFWALCVGESGEDRKSTVVGLARGLLERGVLSKVGNDVEAPGDALPNGDEGKAKKPSKKGKVETGGVVAFKFGSAEQLVSSLSIRPTQLWCIGEFGSFLSAAQSSYYTKIKTEMTDIFDGKTITKTLRNQEAQVALNPRFSVLAGCAPTYLQFYTKKDDWTAGFLSRFCVAFANRERDAHRGRGVGVEDAKLCGYLQWCAMQSAAGQNIVYLDDEGNVLDSSTMEDDAFAYWVEWSMAFKISTKAMYPGLRGQIARTELVAKKIALLNAWDNGRACQPDGQGGFLPWKLTMAELIPAIRLAMLHWQGVEAIAPLASNSKDVHDRALVLKALSANEAKTLGQISRHTSGEVGMKRRLLEVIEVLLEEQAIMVERMGGETYYILHPSMGPALRPGPAPDATPSESTTEGQPPESVVDLEAERLKRQSRPG